MNPNELSLPKLKIVAAALHISILIYVMVPFLIAQSGEGWVVGWQIREEFRMIVLLFAAVACTTGLLSVFIPRIMKLPAAPSTVAHEVSETPLFFDFSVVTARIQTLTIMRMALAESVAILGFVAAFLNQSVYVALPFAAAGLFLQVLVGPFGRFLKGQ